MNFAIANLLLRRVIIVWFAAAVLAGPNQNDRSMNDPVGTWEDDSDQANGMGCSPDELHGLGKAGREMLEGPTIGPDGTLYLVRSLAQAKSIPPSLFRHELTAINPRDGSPRWRLEIQGGMISGPVVAPDGRLFLTISELPPAFSFSRTMSGSASVGSSKAKLLVVATDQRSARIAATVELESDILSAPKLAADGSGGYIVFVTGFERSMMREGHGQDDDFAANGEKRLYCFGPDGRVRYRVTLGNPVRVGMGN